MAVAALTIFFLVLFLWKSDLKSVWAILRSANPAWILAGFGGNLLALLFRAARWRTILDPDHPPRYYPTFLATCMGYALSTVLPVRAGDVIRPALLSRRTSVRFSRALGTVLTERVLDLSAILILYLSFIAISGRKFAHDPATAGKYYLISSAGVVCGAILGGLGIALVCLYFFRARVRLLHEWLARFIPTRFRSSWMGFYDSFVSTLDLANHPAAIFKVLFFTACIWAALTSQFFFATLAVGHYLPYNASFFMTGVTTIGLAVPTPGGVGGFHKACQLVLTNFYAFDIDTSVAVAVLFHLIGVLPVILTAMVLSIREGLNWRQVAHTSEEFAVQQLQREQSGGTDPADSHFASRADR
jgi:glycosyltransferase 2 family protein